MQRRLLVPQLARRGRRLPGRAGSPTTTLTTATRHELRPTGPRPRSTTRRDICPGTLDEPQGGLPRNYLRASLLLLIAETPAHGYDLLDQIAQLGLRNVDPGGLYRALRVMEQDGLVASWWEHSSAGPARRSYRLTDEGVEWLHAWAGRTA